MAKRYERSDTASTRACTNASRWAKSRVWERVFAAPIDDPKNEY